MDVDFNLEVQSRTRVVHYCQLVRHTCSMPLPVVYADNVMQRLMDTFETLVVVSSESMQHQNFIAVARTFAKVFDHLPPNQQQRAEDLVLRILAAPGDHVLTADLDKALTDLAATLKASARFATAAAGRRLKSSSGFQSGN